MQLTAIQKIFVTIITSSLLLSASSSSAARLRGKIAGDTPDRFRVIAIANNGISKSAVVSAVGRFSVNSRKNSTLHLLDVNGQYFGPIVLPAGSRARPRVSGVAGNLKRVSVKTGFATVKRIAADELFTARKIPFNRDAGTNGAGNLGLNFEVSADAPVRIAASVGSDSDQDGLPDVLDVDDDGDSVLDAVDGDSATEAQFEAVSASTLRLELADSLNSNIGAFDNTDIEETIQESLRVLFGVRNNSNGAVSVLSSNADCGELPYCSATSGTATISGSNSIDNSFVGELWTSFDEDSDGRPNLLVEDAVGLIGTNITVFPNANTSQIQPGDTILLDTETSAGTRLLPSLLPFYFVTVPAVKEYTHSVTTDSITYPVADGSNGTAFGTPFSLTSSTVTLTFWRPQRPAIASVEAGDFIDMGGLKYGVVLTFPGFISDEVVHCTPADYSLPSADLQQIAEDGTTSDQIFQDLAGDAVPDATNTLSFTLDLDACITRAGIPTASTEVQVELVATSNAQDQAAQQIWFELP